MSTTHPSVVVADSLEVIDCLTMLGVDHVLGHVQSLGKRGQKKLVRYIHILIHLKTRISDNHLGRKIYHCVYLVSPVSVVGESLKVDHKHLKVKMDKITNTRMNENTGFWRIWYKIPQADSIDQTSLWLVGVFGSWGSTWEQVKLDEIVWLDQEIKRILRIQAFKRIDKRTRKFLLPSIVSTQFLLACVQLQALWQRDDLQQRKHN